MGDEREIERLKTENTSLRRRASQAGIIATDARALLVAVNVQGLNNSVRVANAVRKLEAIIELSAGKG